MSAKLCRGWFCQRLEVVAIALCTYLAAHVLYWLCSAHALDKGRTCLVVLKAYECQYLEATALPPFSQLSIRVLALGCLCSICIYKGVGVFGGMHWYVQGWAASCGGP
jgi:hypothetical protein